MVINFGIWAVKTTDSVMEITEKLMYQEILKWGSVTEDPLAPLSCSGTHTKRTLQLVEVHTIAVYSIYVYM